MSLDYSTIHKHLKQLKFGQNSNGGNGAQTLDEATAVKYLSFLRQDLIVLIGSVASSTQMNSKILNEIIVFTKTLDYVPKSDTLFLLFDSQLFSSLFDLLCLPDIPVEALRGILRICLTYLAGVLPKTRKQGMFKALLSVLCERQESVSDTLRCDALFSSLTSKITFADARMNLNIVDFIAKVLYRLIETIGSSSNDPNVLAVEEQWLLNAVRALYVNNVFGVLSCIKEIGEIEGMTGLRGSMDLTSKWFDKKNLGLKNPIWLECCSLSRDVGILLSNNDIYVDTASKKQVEILAVLSWIGSLKQQKRSLKKMLIECNMSSTFPVLKFISTIKDVIADNKSLDGIFGIWNTDLWYSLLNAGARCWLLSGAKIENEGDMEKVISMVEIIIHWLANQLSVSPNDKSPTTANKDYSVLNNQAINDNSHFENNGNSKFFDYDVITLLEKVDNFDYQEIKALQIKAIHDKRAKKWKNRIMPFENLVHRQVIALVRDQRFLQLSKGSWVYASNPLESGGYRHYFLTLNANSQSIVYKEFMKRTPRNAQTPTLDKDGIHIDFNTITAIEYEDLNQKIDDTGLISIQSERMDVNRIDVMTKTGVFSFYVDTKQLKDIWVDGLRILVADSQFASDKTDFESIPMDMSISEEFFTKSGVSSEVVNQVRTLEDIRLRMQMLELDDYTNDISSTAAAIDSVDWNNLGSNFVYD